MAEGHGGFEFCVDEASPGRNRGHCFVVVRSGNVNEPPLQALAGNLLGGGSRTCKSRLDRRSLGPPWRRRAPVAGGMVALVVAGAVGGLRLFAGERGCGGSLRRHVGKGCLRLVMQHPSALHRLCTQSICAGDRVSGRMRGSTGQPAREGLSLRDWRGTVHGGQPLQQPHQLSSLHWCKHGQLESLRNMILSPTTSARATDNWSLLRLSRACFVILLGLRIGWKCVSVRPHSCFPPDTLTLCCANFLSVEYNSPRHYHQPSVPC